MTDTEIEQSGGIREEKSGRKEVKERNVHSGEVSEDVAGVMTDTEMEQTGGHKEDERKRR